MAWHCIGLDWTGMSSLLLLLPVADGTNSSASSLTHPDPGTAEFPTMLGVGRTHASWAHPALHCAVD